MSVKFVDLSLAIQEGTRSLEMFSGHLKYLTTECPGG